MYRKVKDKEKMKEEKDQKEWGSLFGISPFFF